MIAVITELRYLNGTKERTFILKRDDSTHITAPVHASWESTYERERRSRSEMLVKSGHGGLTATTSLQKCMRLRSTETEYFESSEAVKKTV